MTPTRLSGPGGRERGRGQSSNVLFYCIIHVVIQLFLCLFFIHFEKFEFFLSIGDASMSLVDFSHYHLTFVNSRKKWPLTPAASLSLN